MFFLAFNGFACQHFIEENHWTLLEKPHVCWHTPDDSGPPGDGREATGRCDRPCPRHCTVCWQQQHLLLKPWLARFLPSANLFFNPVSVSLRSLIRSITSFVHGVFVVSFVCHRVFFYRLVFDQSIMHMRLSHSRTIVTFKTLFGVINESLRLRYFRIDIDFNFLRIIV